LHTHEINWMHGSYTRYGPPYQSSTINLENYQTNCYSCLQFSADPRTTGALDSRHVVLPGCWLVPSAEATEAL
jgi:hypothetical protein